MASHESMFDLETLLRANLGALYRYSLRLGRGSPDLAEARVLEAVARAARLAPGPPGGDRAWVFGILTDVYREREGALLAAPEAGIGDVSGGEGHLRELIQVMDQAELEIRAAWWLGSIEGFSIREIAEVLSIPEITVEARLDRAHGILGIRLYEMAGVSCVPAGDQRGGLHGCECLQPTG